MAKKKLRFWELDKGELGRKAQTVFEESQIAADLNQTLQAVVITINSFPADPANKRRRSIEYLVQRKSKAVKTDLVAELNDDGMAIDDLHSDLQESISMPSSDQAHGSE